VTLNVTKVSPARVSAEIATRFDQAEMDGREMSPRRSKSTAVASRGEETLGKGRRALEALFPINSGGFRRESRRR